MDELETAILLCFNPPADKALGEKALRYCQNAKESPDAWATALERLSRGTPRSEVAFWCCQVLHETFSDPSRYPGSFSKEQMTNLREGFVAYFLRVASGKVNHGGNALPSFLLNKIAQVIVSIIAADYPTAWQLPFKGLILPLVKDPQIVSESSTAMFFRILRAIDEDVTSIRASQQSARHRAISMRVKDAMRDDCISELVATTASFIKTKYVSHAFGIVARYVEWVDIALIVDDHILQPMYAAITAVSACDSRPAAAATLRAIITKRMDSASKIALLTALKIETLLQSIPAGFLVAGTDECADSELQLQSGQVEVAALVNTIAMIALEVLKEAVKQKKQTTVDPASQGIAAHLAQTALPVALRFMDGNVEEGTSSQALQCVATYVNVFARLSENESSESRAARIAAISAILNVVEERSVLPQDFDPNDEEPEEHPYLPELRRVLIKTIFPSVVRAFPAISVEFVTSLFSKAAESRDIARTELALEMVLVLTATAAEVPEVLELRRAVVGSPPPCMDFTSDVPDASMTKLQVAQKHQLELISTTYFNHVARSYRLFLNQNDPSLLSSVLPVFFDGRGLGHRSSEVVRSQAAYCLLKLSRPLRSVVNSTHLEAVLNAAQVHMFPLDRDINSQLSKNQMNIYETVGYLLGADHKGGNSLRYLSAILKPLIDGLNDNSSPGALALITAAGYLSKGFGLDSNLLIFLTGDATGSQDIDERLSPSGSDDAHGKEITPQQASQLTQEMKVVWITSLEAVLKASSACLQVGKDDKLLQLRAKLLFFLRRMVETIGRAILPYLEQVLPELLKSSSSSTELRDALILASQAITKFDCSFETVAFQVYGPAVQRALAVSYTLDPQTLRAISEESREAVEMHRAYIYFIHALMNTEMNQIILHPSHQQLLQPVILSVIDTAIGESLDIRVAAAVMKMALDTLRKMVTLWKPGLYNETTTGPPGFVQFALEKIAPATIASGVRGTIFRAGDYESNQAESVVHEILTVQRVCALRLGRPFAEALMRDALRSVPKTLVEPYLTALYESEANGNVLLPSVTAIFKILRTS